MDRRFSCPILISPVHYDAGSMTFSSCCHPRTKKKINGSQLKLGNNARNARISNYPTIKCQPLGQATDASIVKCHANLPLQFATGACHSLSQRVFLLLFIGRG